MASVPNTTTFCLSDVTAVVGGTCLSSAVANASPSGFDPSYGGTCTCLLNFRNYNDVVWKTVNFGNVGSGGYYGYRYINGCTCEVPSMDAGDCYTLCLYHEIYLDQYEGSAAYVGMNVYCNSSNIYSCYWYRDSGNYGMTNWNCNICVRSGDWIEVSQEACSDCYQGAYAYTQINGVSGTVGSFCLDYTCTSLSANAP
jgi:hypothetical protein